MSSCPPRDRFQDLLAERLSPAERAVLDQHLRKCPVCEQLLADLANADSPLLLPPGGETETVQPEAKPLLQRLKGHQPPDSPEPATPVTLGRYRIVRVLGQGAFGTVYLGQDPDMDRPVAIKVPSAGLLNSRQSREQFLHEARAVAALRHSHIVRVYDFGSENELCYLVYEYIEGTNLAERLQREALSADQAALLVADVAEAAHAAHLERLFHRDIKPANILLDRQDRPYLADFGLAVREENLGQERGCRSGTPQYMSPEQVRREGHLIDGRTDVYSLGVVLYEALCGQRPFLAATLAELADLILHREARPPRQINRQIPRELERICLKAMAKRITDRYTTASDLAEELRAAVARPAPGSGVLPGPAKVVPKGLRSFGPEDADFFMQLLPGPYHRDGLPEALRFWKIRMESADPESTFRVGLIHGPSGCGKTSLVRAALLPRLMQVTPIYVEAAYQATESRLLNKLASLLPGAEPQSDLAAAVARLRQGPGLPSGRKVLIVVDQFEQWLHAQETELSASPLVAALRQADGVHVQFLLMIRDDFWSAISRLFDVLEIPMDSTQNVRLVDLFDQRHARQVLELFGQAYSCLPERAADYTAEQRAFLDQVVQGLSQDGKVISVRLSLLADMMKARPWTPQALQAVGGLQGVGVTFLEETFSVQSAPPEYRQFALPARRLLAALLPDAGSDIKGKMRSTDELRQASGLENQPQRFEQLLRVLNHELRIITPTQQEADPSTGPTTSGSGYYQLTHDYLVGPLREWLSQQKRQNWRGRAELCLEERTAEWTRNRNWRFLPSPWQLLTILLGVPRRQRKPEQRAMLQAAVWRYGKVMTAMLLVAVLGGALAWEINGRMHGRRLVQAISVATPGELENIIDRELPPYRRWVEPTLRTLAEQGSAVQRRRACMALSSLESDHVDFLRQQVLDCPLDEFSLVSERLRTYREQLAPWLWQVCLHPQEVAAFRFRAAMVLANFSPEAAEWDKTDMLFLAQQLLVSNPDDQRTLRRLLAPLRGRLIVALEKLFHDPTLGQAAVAALIDFAADDRARLARLATEASPGQFHILFSELSGSREHDAKVRAALRDVLREPDDGESARKRVFSSQRKARAAIMLLRLGDDRDALTGLDDPETPEVLSQLAAAVKDYGLKPVDLVTQLDRRQDEHIRFTLLLALGEFTTSEVPESLRTALVQKLRQWHQHNPSSGIHAACEWLLRHWQEELPIDHFVNEPAPPAYAPDRQQWFILSLGRCRAQFVIMPPGKFLMGSPRDEEYRQSDEKRHQVELTRAFAILDREVTMELWLQFLEDMNRRPEWEARDKREEKFTRPDYPACHLRWQEAIEFCNWLTLKAGMPEASQCYVPVKHPEGSAPRWQFHPEQNGFRLPTEAEWEYACRAGSTATFCFGSDLALLRHYSVLLEHSGRKPAVVASKRPNRRGLFDMHGNVWEWCHDWYDNWDDRQSAKDPLGPEEGKTRVYRGGSYDNSVRHHRAACRINDTPSYHFPYLGLRVVCTLPMISP